MKLRTTALALTLSATLVSPSAFALSDYQLKAIKQPLESNYMKRDQAFFDGKQVNPNISFEDFFKNYYSPYSKYLDQAIDKFNALSARDQSDPRVGPVLEELQAAVEWRKGMNADFDRAQSAAKQRAAEQTAAAAVVPAAPVATAPAVAPVAAAPAPAANAPLTFAQKKTMRNIDREVGNVIRRVPRLNSASELDRDEKKLDEYQRVLGTHAIPASDATYQRLQQKFAQARQAVSDKQAEFGPAAGPVTAADAEQYAKDMELVKDLTHQYQPAAGVNPDERSGMMWAELAESIAWAEGLQAQHANLINSDLAEKRNFENKMKHLMRSLNGWGSAVERRAQDVMADIGRMVKQIEQDAERGKEMKQPAFFTNGIPRTIARARANFEFLDHAQKFQPEIADLAKQLDSAEHSAKEAAEAIEKEVLAAARVPAEAYSGSDKGGLKAQIEAAWKKAYPGEDILGVVFHHDSWKRNNLWRWNGTLTRWEHSDWSYLATSVVIKNSDDIATVYVAYVNKNNLSGESNIGVQTRSGKHVVTKVLVENVKL